MVVFLGHGPGVLALALAHPVQGVPGAFPVQDAVAAAGAFPGAEGAQLGRGDHGLGAAAFQAREVIVGHPSGVAVFRGVPAGPDVEAEGGPGEHAFAAVEGFPGRHGDERGGLPVLAWRSAHRRCPW